MTVFVIGGTGLIGSHATRAISAAGHEVIALARSPDAESKLADWGIRSIRGGAHDRDVIAHGIAAADTVVFTAAIGEAETAVVDWMIDGVRHDDE